MLWPEREDGVEPCLGPQPARQLPPKARLGGRLLLEETPPMEKRRAAPGLLREQTQGVQVRHWVVGAQIVAQAEGQMEKETGQPWLLWVVVPESAGYSSR